MKTSISKEKASIGSTAFHQLAHKQARILMVDDNLEFLELYSEILRAAGYEVFTACNGGQALRAVHEHEPSLVVLDVVLPDMSGVEVCRKIKGDASLGDILVILISGHAVSPEQTVDGLAVGADEYLRKPVSPREFLARISTMVRLIQTTAALRASEQHYRRLVEVLPDSVALLDINFRLAGVNQRVTAMLGYGKPDDLLRKSVFDLIESKDHDRFRASIAALKPGAAASGEYNFLSRSCRSIPVEMSTVRSATPDGENVGWVMVARDITERRHAEEELRSLPRRITEAQEAERLRVSRELHDGVNQMIASATMRMRRVQDTIASQFPAASEILSRCQKLLDQALEENRRIARNLRPNDLDEFGLSTACRNLGKELQARTGLMVKCHFARVDQPLPPQVDLGLFRIVQEALNNVEKHARAKVVRLRIAIQDQAVFLKIQDNGRGFDLNAQKVTEGGRRGIGLSSLQERADALGGTCDVASAPGRGTVVTVRVPIAKARPVKATR